MVHFQKAQWFNIIPIEIQYKPKPMVEISCLCGLHQKIRRKSGVQGRKTKILMK
jgi:hypothetical protein